MQQVGTVGTVGTVKQKVQVGTDRTVCSRYQLLKKEIGKPKITKKITTVIKREHSV